jgi:hypothetical protein
MALTKRILATASAVGLAVACSIALAQKADQRTNSTAAKAASGQSVVTAYRRLTESQYRHAIADAFGPAVVINARFEPERRETGLQAVGNARLSITTSGLEQYLSVARSISDQVIDGKNRDELVGCALGTNAAADATCAKRLIEQRGRQLFRRPLRTDEIALYSDMYSRGAQAPGTAAKGLKLALIGVLMAPEFLFRVERAEAAAGDSGSRLDAYTKAARVSYLLWDAGPDEELLQTASSGAIHNPEVLAKQIDRLLASPRMEAGIRAFFTDMLQFEAFDTLSKDGTTYPKFSQSVADSAREETLKFLVDQLMTKSGDYRDIFTSRETFINRTLAAVYNVPYPSTEPWARFTFPEQSERSGILTQVTFLSLAAHPGSSSPTIRGVKLYESFMCLALPPPPPDVDFSKVQATEKGTVRTRLIEHKTNPGCFGCHNVSDPPGLALERFDGLGQHRVLENGAPIDVSAEIGGKKFAGSVGLGQFLHDNPVVPQCLVRNVHYYGVGRGLDSNDDEYLTRQRRAFAEKGYRVPELMRSILNDPHFYRVVTPEGAARTASATPQSGDKR